MELTFPIDSAAASAAVKAAAKSIPQAGATGTGEWLVFVVTVFVFLTVVILGWHAISLAFERRKSVRIKDTDVSDIDTDQTRRQAGGCREDCSEIRGLEKFLGSRIDSFKELVESRLDSVEKNFETRINTVQASMNDMEKRQEVRLSAFTASLAESFRSVYSAIAEVDKKHGG